MTIDQAASELANITARLESNTPPDQPRGLVPVVRSLENAIVGDARPAMLALFGAVSLVLLIAAANVTNLLLLRGEVRRRELAVRAALGASRGRILSLLFAESLALAAAAAAAAFVASWWGLEALLTTIPAGLPMGDAIRIDARVVAFMLVIALLTALAAGIVPGLASLRRDLLAHLRNGHPRSDGVVGRRVLVAAQVGLAVMIVAGAGLLTRSLLRLQAADLGLSPDRLVFIDLVPTPKFMDPSYHARFLDELVGQLQSTSVIAAATPVNVAPFSGLGGWDVPRFTAAGQGAADAAANPALNLESIHPGYFETFQIRILRGRSFTEADREGALYVAIVSDDVAARTWPGEDPIGKRLKMGGLQSEDPWRTVVGVAQSTRYRELAEMRPTLYLPAKQFLNTARLLVVRSTASLDLIASLTRERVRAIDPGVHVVRVAPFSQLLDAPLARPRFIASLVGIFATAALFLATVGLYAVLAAFVRQRDREIGIRVALGATAADVPQSGPDPGGTPGRGRRRRRSDRIAGSHPAGARTAIRDRPGRSADTRRGGDCADRGIPAGRLCTDAPGDAARSLGDASPPLRGASIVVLGASIVVLGSSIGGSGGLRSWFWDLRSWFWGLRSWFWEASNVVPRSAPRASTPTPMEDAEPWNLENPRNLKNLLMNPTEPRRGHSTRRATRGSTFAARRAGR